VEISKRNVQLLSKSQAHLHRDGPQRRESEQGRAGLVHPSTDSNAILIQTGADSWKAKRIRRGSPVLVWLGQRGRSGFHRQGRDY